MAEYSKKLHIRKGSTVTDITLYTDIKDVEKDYLVLRDGSNKVYAALVPLTDNDATWLRVRKGSTVFAVGKVSPLYSAVGIVIASAGHGVAHWAKIRGNGLPLYDPDPTGAVSDAVGIVMASAGNGSIHWVKIDKDGNNI